MRRRLVLALVLVLCGCAGPTATTGGTPSPARFEDCARAADPTPPPKGVDLPPGPATTYEQDVAAIDRAHRRDRQAAAAFTAAGRDASRLPRVEHPGSLLGPEAPTLQAAGQAAEQVLVGEVVGMAHGVRSTARVRVEVAVRGARAGQELDVWAGGTVVLPPGRDCLDDAQWLSWGNALSLFAGRRVVLLLVPDDGVGGRRPLLGVGAYDVTSGRVAGLPRLHPFAGQVVGLTEAELLARLSGPAG